MARPNLDRGVTIRRDPSTGAEVYMYKDTPGVFLNSHGGEVDDRLAARAGFDVKTLKRERAKREAMVKAVADVEAAFQQDKRGGSPEEKVIGETQDGFRAIQYAFGRCHVFDPEGNRVNERFLTVQEAETFLREIDKAGPEPSEPEQEQPKPEKKGKGSEESKDKQEDKDGASA